VRKNIHMPRPVKEKLGLKVSGANCDPCKCVRVCVGQTGRSIEPRCKEYMSVA
jgi:hypothetical protein